MDEYINMLRIQEANAGLFFQDQSYLNIMVFRASQSGRIKRHMVHLQTPVPVFSKNELENRIQIKDGEPLPWKQPTVVHWAGPKPYTANPDAFSLPMDYFREIGMRDLGLPKWFPTKTAMQADEFWHRDMPKGVLKAKKLIKNIIGRK